MPGQRSGLVTLLTDFGLRDPFVGILHGVIASRGPELKVVDLTHQVPAQAIGCGAFYLCHAFRWFPPGTVHVAVVDPGVGSARHAVVLEALGHLFVGPDNGLLGDVLAVAELEGAPISAHRIDLAAPALKLGEPSATFHGRDVFAPVGAELARGMLPSDVGPELTKLEPTPNSPVKHVEGGLEAQVVVVDHFGNCITNLPVHQACPDAAQHPERYQVWLEELGLPLVRTYSDVAEGALCALISSFGTLEIAQRNGNALRQIKLFAEAAAEAGMDVTQLARSGLGVGSPVRLIKRP